MECKQNITVLKRYKSSGYVVKTRSHIQCLILLAELLCITGQNMPDDVTKVV